MAPIYTRGREKPEQARYCVDQFEFPNIPCDYPVTWVKASEAAELCEAVGKRLCDAHEWENGCSGDNLAPDYGFPSSGSPSYSQKRIRRRHNAKRKITWAYGKKTKPSSMRHHQPKVSRLQPGDNRSRRQHLGHLWIQYFSCWSLSKLQESL